MLNKPGGYRAVVLAFIALCIVASIVGAKAKDGNNNGALKIASFDQNRLITEYKFTVETDKAMQKKRDDTQLMLQTWAQNALLVDQDQKRLGELAQEERTAGANFDPGKKNEMKKLQEQSRQLGDEFTSLQGNQNPTPAQQQRLTVLTRAYSDTQARIDSIRKTVVAELDKQDQESQAKIVKDMREAIAQVAKAKGFSLVLPNNIAWFSENDITEAVLGAMNGKK